ncbi:hypothetical protein IK7_05817 [Bacillus cereus VD156]|uniref:DMT family transporter n=1 Tax=Bacillus cereus TaxID=1396 RepID=UPI000279CC04|nr:multidrug efflux SMR transporter [Bacillus cereus]EJR73145.1 hypothetical protein IK7_05817 [Bacillus cereus VD156]
MNKNWMKVFIAAFFEIFWVIGLKYTDNFWAWTGTVIAIIISFYLMIMAGRKIPVGTAYAVWTGIGASGGAILGMLLYGESKDWRRIIFIAMVLGAAIGLKLVS